MTKESPTLYRIVLVTEETTSCLIIPSTDGCCEQPLVAEIVEPCEHGNYDRHVLAEFGWFGRSWCQGAGLTNTPEEES